MMKAVRVGTFPSRLGSMLVCVAAVATAPAGAQERARPGPEAAFEQLFETMREGDWAACARLMHPDALAEFHQFFVSLAQADDSGEAASVFFGREPEEVATLAPPVTFERVMRGVLLMNPGMDEAFRTSKMTILGSVAEGEMVHVVYRFRTELGGAGVSKVGVVSMKPYGDAWRALLTGEMEGMIQTLGGQMDN